MKNTMNGETPILIIYTFASCKYNHELFADLRQIRTEFDVDDLRIVCLNPFNSKEEIDTYLKAHHIEFDMEADEKNSSLFYQVNSYPSAILMENSGKIIHRHNGYCEDLPDRIEKQLKNRKLEISLKPRAVSDYVGLQNYKNNLLSQFP